MTMLKTRVQLSALPPSVNHIYRFTRGGKMYRTEAYNTWANGEGYMLNRQLAGQHKFIGPVYLTLAMKRRRANQDGDNLQKAIFDLLQGHRAIDNDKNVMGCNWFWTEHLPEGVAAEISIIAADALAIHKAA